MSETAVCRSADPEPATLLGFTSTGGELLGSIHRLLTRALSVLWYWFLLMHSKQSFFSSRPMAVGAAVGIFLLYFYGLGRTPLLDPDEPVYGQIAREMVRTGDWLTPHLAGRPWFDKPPLFYWAEAAAMLGFGSTELAARLPSAVAAMLLALLVLAVGRRLLGPAAGWAAAAVLATSLQTIILGRAAVTDMLFALTLMASLTAFALWHEARGRSHGWAAACGMALGLSVLCKGPVAVLLLGVPALLFLAWERKLGQLLGIGTLIALLCCLLIAGPWYGAMLTLHRRAFINQFIDANNLRRFAESEHQSGASPFFFVPVLLLFLFPWSPLLPQAVAAGWRHWAGRLLLCWIGFVFIFFSASSTKLVTYIYPLYPAAALLIGACLVGSRSERLDHTTSQAVPTVAAPNPRAVYSLFPVACTTAVLGLSLGVVLVFVALKQYPAALLGAVALGFLFVIGTVWGIGAARRGGTPLIAYTVMMTGVAVVLAGVVVPRVAPSVSLRELAIWQETTHRPLVGFRLQAPGFLFYSGRELPNETRIAGLEARVQEVPDLAVAMSSHAVPELAAATPDVEWRIIWQRGNRVVVEPVRSARKPGSVSIRGAEEAKPAASLRVISSATIPDVSHYPVRRERRAAITQQSRGASG